MKYPGQFTKKIHLSDGKVMKIRQETELKLTLRVSMINKDADTVDIIIEKPSPFTRNVKRIE